MKAVIDTNVLISGLISPNGMPARIIDLWLANKITVCVNSEIIEEYLTVLLRPKFRSVGSPQERYELISGLVELENTKIVNSDLRLNVVTEDADDNVFVECAVEAQAEVIVSGDDHLLNLIEYAGIKIVSPSEFLQQFF